jgi:hypothetical protein
MNIANRLRAVEEEGRQAWTTRIEADLSVLATKLASLGWEPGGVMVVRDEVERAEYLEALRRIERALAQHLRRPERGTPSSVQSGLRFTTESVRSSLTHTTCGALVVDHQTLRRTLRHARRALSLDATLADLLKQADETLQRGEQMLERLRVRFARVESDAARGVAGASINPTTREHV